MFHKTKSSHIDGEAKLLICLIMQKFDNYNDEYKMVSNSILKQNSIWVQHFTENYSIDDISEMTKSIDIAEPKIQQLIELLFEDNLINLIEDGSEEIEQKFEYLLFKFERSLRPKKLPLQAILNRKGVVLFT